MKEQFNNPGKVNKEMFNGQPLSGSENEFSGNMEDTLLFQSVSQIMKGRFDLEDVVSDPALDQTKEKVVEMIADYNKNTRSNRENENFVRNAMNNDSSLKTSEEIRMIKKEIKAKKLDLVTAEWVKEWHAKKQMAGIPDPKAEERRNFVADAINSQPVELRSTPEEGKKKSISRRLFVRYISLSAAAFIAAVILIGTLLNSNNPDKLFRSYYAPFDAVSPVTRSVNGNLNNDYSDAIANYKKGNYSTAIAGFNAVLERDPSSKPAMFFMGLSQLAIGNLEKSAGFLSPVAAGSGDYGKEAEWYLGLTYLKEGDITRAKDCFTFLSKSNGYYSERSGKLLRRLNK